MIWPNCETVYFFEGKSKYKQEILLSFHSDPKLKIPFGNVWEILFHKYYSKHHEITIPI